MTVTSLCQLSKCQQESCQNDHDGVHGQNGSLAKRPETSLLQERTSVSIDGKCMIMRARIFMLTSVRSKATM